MGISSMHFLSEMGLEVLTMDTSLMDLVETF